MIRAVKRQSDPVALLMVGAVLLIGAVLIGLQVLGYVAALLHG